MPPGVDPDQAGELMLITDHIKRGDNPLFGPNVEALGPRFPALTDAYDPELAERARARRRGLASGSTRVYVMLRDRPQSRRRARLLRRLGADAVGMSTVVRRSSWPGTPGSGCSPSLITNGRPPPRPGRPTRRSSR